MGQVFDHQEQPWSVCCFEKDDHTPSCYRADTENELNISPMRTLRRSGPDEEEHGDGAGERTWEAEGRDTLSFDRISGNLLKRSCRALMC